MRYSRFLLLLLAVALPSQALASDEAHGIGGDVWLALAAILIVAKIGAEAAIRLRQPPVLGELVAGMVLGNLGVLGIHQFDFVPKLPAVEFLAELGVVLMLFEVGLESTLTEMRKVAPQSGLVAVLGVVAPMALGYFASSLLLPDEPLSLHFFVGATLCATSVGITARVLQDIGAMDRPETRVILGAAVIDDVLGLMVLAIVRPIAFAGVPSIGTLSKIVGLAVGFLLGALFLGTFIMPGFFRASSKLRTPGVLASISVGLCLLLAGLSAQMGLAAIVGAFAAGLILDEVHVQPFGKKSKHDLSPLVAPIVNILAPIFFVRTGMLVKLGSVTTTALGLAAALSVVAVIGKLVAGFGIAPSKGNRLVVGIGMVPRGEVGLIFANVGAEIVVHGKPLLSGTVFSAIVLMVMVTTVISPPWLAIELSRRAGGGGKGRNDKS